MHCFEIMVFLQRESPRSGLHWLYLAMALLKTLFWRTYLRSGCCIFMMVRVLLLRVFITPTGSLFYFSLFFIFFLVVCILDVFRYLVGAEAGCNWYLRDINIFRLSKKNACCIYLRSIFLPSYNLSTM